jgi:hypothetical protein
MPKALQHGTKYALECQGEKKVSKGRLGEENCNSNLLLTALTTMGTCIARIGCKHQQNLTRLGLY